MAFCRITLCALLTLFLPVVLIGQSESLKIFGRVMDDKDASPIPSCRLTVLKEGQITTTQDLRGKSGYSVELRTGFIYDLRFESTGYMQKVIRIDARNIPPQLNQTQFEINADGSLLRYQDGFDLSIWDVPFARLVLDKSTGDFLPDQSYLNQRKVLVEEELKRLINLNDDPEYWQQRFDSLMVHGSNLLQLDEPYSARDTFYGALGIFPANVLAEQKLQQALSRIEELENEYRRKLEYQELLASGDSLMFAGNFRGALISFKAARDIDPTILVKEKVFDAEQALEKEALWKEYYDWMRNAADDFYAGDYSGAISSYTRASEIFPDEELPHVQILVCREALFHLNMLAGRKLTYDSLVALGDWQFTENKLQSAIDTYTEASLIYPSEEYPPAQIERLRALLGDGGTSNIPLAAAVPQDGNGARKNGISIRHFVLGNKKVQEYVVENGKRTDIYRRVEGAHSTYYFFNNRSMTAEAWKQAISKLDLK